ncbi:MAG: hypothetical protein JSW27_09825 [Phycisphaerales bacterium]|nr:MAG: hypothetical protein JSW27_09825 [Phycisphaerales bacterium]
MTDRREEVRVVAVPTAQSIANRYTASRVGLLLLVCALTMLQVCAANGSSLPTFRAVTPERPTTIEDFRKELAEVKEQAPDLARSEALIGGGVMALAGAENVGDILDIEIEELARGLKYDPGLMYGFVHDNIQFYPMWGDVKGAAMALLDRSGGGFDQASLMIALLEEAASQPDTPRTIANVRYVVGVIDLTAAQVTNWLGIPDDYLVAANVIGLAGIPATISPNPDGTINHIQMGHVWVKTTIDSQAYEFDPSFKNHTFKPGLTGSQLAAAMGYSQSAFLTSAQEGATIGTDYISDVNRVNVTGDLTDYSMNLVDYIKSNCPGGDLADIVGGKTVIPAGESVLPPSSLPYTVVSRDYEFPIGSIPGGWGTWVRFTHGGIDGWLSSSAIYGRRLVIQYDTSNRTQLVLDGTVLATGAALVPGQSYPLTLELDHPYDHADESRTFSIRAGGVYNVINGWGNVGTRVIERHRQILQQNRQSGYAGDSDEVLGKSLALMGFTWLAEHCRTSSLVGQLMECTAISHHCLGISGQYGSPYIDMQLVFVSLPSLTRTAEDAMAAFLTTGGQGSAYEYGVFHQLQDYNAVSTIRLLSAANDRTSEDKIFAATAANWTTIEPQLVAYDVSEKNQVYDFIQGGFTVYLPEYGDLGDEDWTGIGYMATDVDDPNSFSAAYMISGGYNGGYAGPLDAYLDGDEMLRRLFDEWLWYGPPSSHAETPEPIDLVTGAYTYGRTDLSTGNGDLPFGLSFVRQYNSTQHAEDGPLGLGWTHALDIRAKVISDGFQVMGDDSPIDAAASVAALYVVHDLLSSPSLANNVVACLSQKWLMDQMIDNSVVIKQGQDASQFVRLPDGSFNPPPGKAIQLIEEQDDTLRLKDAAGNFLDFDPNGCAEQWSDPHGNVVDFAYSNGKLASVVSKIGGISASRTLSFTYDVNDPNHISVVTDSAGRSISFGYDAAGNLIAHMDPETHVTTYEYDPNNDGQLTKIFYPTAPTSPFVTNEYDNLGRVIRQTNAMNDPNNAYDYYYAYYRTEELGPSQTPPSGPDARYAKVYTFDDHGRTLTVEDQLGRRATMEYDGQQRVTRITSPAGTITEYLYDENHNIIQTTGIASPGHTEPNTVESFTYSSYVSAADRWFTDLLQHVDMAGNTTSYVYDYNDVQTHRSEVGNLMEIIYPEVDPPGDVNQPTVEFTYYSSGQLHTETDPNGLVTHYAYTSPASGSNLKTRTVDPNGCDITAEFAYDSVGNVTSLEDSLGNITTSEYYPSRRLKKTVSPLPFNYATAYEYYDDGKLKHVKRYLGSSSGSSGGSAGASCVARYRHEADGLGLDTQGENDLTNNGVALRTYGQMEGETCGTYSHTEGDYQVITDANLSADFPGKSGTSNGSFTICGWFRSGWLWSNGDMYVVRKFDANDLSFGLRVNCVNGVRRFQMVVGYDDGDSYDSYLHGSTVSTLTWYHVATTWENSTKAYRIRVWDDTGGAILGTDLTGTGSHEMSPAAGDFILGGTWTGEMDDVAVFNYALTPSEIDEVRQQTFDYHRGPGSDFSNDPNCVALWRLEASALTADSIGSNTLTNSNAASDANDYQEGSACADFEGDDLAKLYIADADLDGEFPFKSGTSNNKISVCFWAKWESITNYQEIVGKTDNDTNDVSFSIWNDPSGHITMGIGYNGGASEEELVLSSAVTTGRWYHVGATFDDDTKSWKMRVWDDTAGAILASDSGTATNNVNFTDIGWYLGDGAVDGYPFDGKLDEVLVFNDILTTEEIDEIREATYGASSGGSGSGDVAYLQSITYTATGKKETVRGPYPEDPTPAELQVNYTQYSYDALDRLWKVTDAEDNVTETRYYPDGQVWKIIDANDNAAVTNVYNDDGSLRQVIDAKGNVTEYDYDGFVALTKTTFEDGTYEQIDYDAFRRPQKTVKRGDQEITLTYDDLNRVTVKDANDPDDSSLDNIITYAYDLTGKLLEVTDNTGSTAYTYDAVDRLVGVGYPGGKGVAYEYDDNGNRTKLTYPDSSYITYEYDELSRLVAVRDDDNSVLAAYSYDERSRRDGLSYANGASIEYAYDVANRLLDVNNITNTGSTEYAYTYDDVSNRSSMSVIDSSGTSNHGYTYDSIYQLTDVNYPADVNYLATDTTFVYDAVGNRTSVVDDAGTVSYTTNALNQYSAVAGTNYTYDDNGNLTFDDVYAYAYDPENRLIAVSLAAAQGDPLAQALDTDLSFTTGGDASWYAQTSESYYDSDAAQSGAISDSQETWLETEVVGAGTLTFYWKVSSKKNSDWLEFYIDDVRQDRISGNVNWQPQSHNVTGAESHTLKWRYVKDSSTSGGSDCGWVDYVQWSGASPGPAWETITYTYDPSGRRIAKALDGETAVRYVYDGSQCIAEYDANDVLLRKYIYGPGIDQPICMIDVVDGNAVYYYHFDGLGSVVALSDSLGDTVQTYEYSVYGQVAASDPNHPNPYLFTARRFDSETGLYDYRARCYNPYIGRFLQTDPISYADGLNWYTYCGNNPVLFIDPWGLCETEVEYDYLSALYRITNGYGGDVLGTLRAIPGGVGNALTGFKDALTRVFVDPVGLVKDTVSGAYNAVRHPIQTAGRVIDPLLSSDPTVSGTAIGQLVGDAAIGAVGAKLVGRVIDGPPRAAGAPEATAGSGTTYEQLVSNAKKAYPKKAGIKENHHITPKYLGGSPKGPTVPLDAAYHQQITNAFQWTYGYRQSVPDPVTLQTIKQKVYSQYPLPPGTEW